MEPIGLVSSTMSSPLLISATGLLLVATVIWFLLNRPKRLDLPVVDIPGNSDKREALIQGTTRYPDSPFIIITERPTVILPISVIDEVRNLPENKVSFTKDVQKVMAYKQTDIGSEADEVLTAVKVDLTRNIAGTLDDLQEEAQYGFDKEFGPCEDWTPYTFYGKVTRLVSLISGRVFVGRPLSREEEWIDATVQYAYYCMKATQALHEYPSYLRSIVAPFVTELNDLKKFRRRGAELLRPILEQLLAKGQHEKIYRDDVADEQGTMLAWILKYTPEHHRSNADMLANHQMILSFAAIHTTSMATTAAIFDLATYPEYIQLLRDEIQQVIDEDGQDINGDGIMRLKKASIPRLWKLDSFLKESQRFSPPNIVTGTRLTTCDLALSTGHVLPRGTRFGFASWAVHQSSKPPALNPILNPLSKPVSQFDGLRFYHARKIAGNENKHQFVTTSPDSLSFGHGNHACPGRFFASNEIKVVLIELLRNWDFRFVGDIKREGGIERRPKNVFDDVNCIPDMEGKVELKRRKR
ncbi:hypothetical protein VTL71DRAFT_4850 [Oculimacula yallundae]|uniref:Cytochrome P450 n=1 Tax=Oculimacula yallundae TaxID=86028 RepID=A0ABR4C4C5_9HELO